MEKGWVNNQNTERISNTSCHSRLSLSLSSSLVSIKMRMEFCVRETVTWLEWQKEEEDKIVEWRRKETERVNDRRWMKRRERRKEGSNECLTTFFFFHLKNTQWEQVWIVVSLSLLSSHSIVNVSISSHSLSEQPFPTLSLSLKENYTTVLFRYCILCILWMEGFFCVCKS